MKIIIIGAGIAGLSTYLALHKYLPEDDDEDSNSDGVKVKQRHDIRIYEAHDVSRYLSPSPSNDGRRATTTPEHEEEEALTTFTPEAIGSAIGIAKNGLDVLARLDGTVDEDGGGGSNSCSTMIHRLLATGHPVSKWKIGSARGWKLVDAEMVPPGSNKKAITGVMVSRQGMWKILLDEVARVGGKGAVRRATIREVVVPAAAGRGGKEEGTQADTGPAQGKPVVVLDDGSRETADLVVGADGLRSVVRKAMFPPKVDGEEKAASPSSSVLGWLMSWFRQGPAAAPEDYVTPRYEGLVGVSSFLPSSLLTSTDHEPGTMAITFGPNGFWGCGFISTSASNGKAPLTLSTAHPAPEPGPTAVYWSTFPSAEEWPYHHKHEDGSRSKPQDFDRSAALRGMLSRQKHWKNPSIQAILKHAEENPEKVIKQFYPTWTTAPLPNWHQGGVVLVGDAAHALQPSSGQGACQAMEDAEVLARCLRHFIERRNSGEHVSVEEACVKYEQVRMPRVKEIYERSQRMSRMKGDMSWIEEMLMYAIVKIMGMLHDGANERIVGYDLPSEVDKALKTP